MKGKYIITKEGYPILFCSEQAHRDFSKFNPVSAGMFYLNGTEVNVYGESIKN